MTTKDTKASYASHRGVSKPAVTKWSKQGWLVWTDDGYIDREHTDERLAGRGKPKNGAETKAAQQSAAEPQPQAAPAGAEAPALAERVAEASSEAQSSLRVLIEHLELMTKAEAEQVKENYLALQRRLEYEQAAGELVPVEQVAQQVAAEYATLRSKLLALPTELAPQIAQEIGGDANHIRERLAEGITRALEELTHDTGGNGH